MLTLRRAMLLTLVLPGIASSCFGTALAAGIAGGALAAYALSRKSDEASDFDMQPITIAMAGAATGGISVAFSLPLTGTLAD